MMKRTIVVLIALLVPARAYAQGTLAKGFTPDGLPTVFVLDDRGVETRGLLLKLDDEAVVVLVGSEQRWFETRRVNKITRRGDSLRNGAIAGAVFGACMGVFAAGMSDCPSHGGCAGFRILAVPLSAAFYTALGTGIDAMVQGRTVIYQAPALRIAADQKGASVGLTLRW
jgi:hypothetical protein